VNVLRHAGTPDAKGGKETAQLLLDEFDSLGKEFKGAQADAVFLEFTPERDFPADLGALQQRIQQAISGAVQRIGANIDPTVNAAFDSNKACAAISSTWTRPVPRPRTGVSTTRYTRRTDAALVLRSASTAAAAFRPLTAITDPPGWVAAPHRYTPSTPVRAPKRRSHICAGRHSPWKM